MTVHLLGACLFTTALAPGMACAQELVLVVRAADADRAAAQALEAEVQAALQAAGHQARLTPPLESPESSAEARTRAWESARRAFQELRPEEALRGSEELVRAGDLDAGAGLSADAWVDVFLLLALVRASLGDDPGADAAVDRALAMRPELEASPQRWAPPLVSRVERARQARDGATGVVHIMAEPAEASVVVDGEVCSAPASLTLSVGMHRLLVELPGYQPSAQLIHVRAQSDETRTVLLAFEPSYWLRHAGEPGALLDSRVERAAASWGARLLLVDLQRDEGGLRADIVDGTRRSSALLIGLEPAAHATQIVEAWEASRGVATDAVPDPVIPDPGSWDPAPWIALGVGVAAAIAVAIGLGVGLGTQSSTGFTLRGELP